MKIVLATSNNGKVRELSQMLSGFSVLGLSDVCEPFEIVEDGDSFAANALIKSRAVYEKIKGLGDDFVALSDDSGISVDVLGGAPGIHSARYADGTEEGNRAALRRAIIDAGVDSSGAHYTACISVVCALGEYYTHGFMHGRAFSFERGSGGFGYDAMFIPEGFSETLAELSPSIKERLSHRSKAIYSMLPVLKMLSKKL
ncbi:non-canonical purine NTP pyrophosphatase [Campylobacter sp. 19-13652]|uniref:non-canonical purine NTP pyrophosphatase n=1 Tax=Campylobacter sp. 19-13652 TaxID=2840180 RepID=UPI001C75D35D|nr:non-canonical purine NTP pyrophosphatase [Campylobacter sp. 19-13652]BCX79984.1 non-canonical purine NTP pyrophosphatase [Campylobacter sp. 19-13652]